FVHGLNAVVLVVLCFSYSKRSRVEALYALRDQPPTRGILVEDSAEGEAPMPPLFYLGKWDIAVIPWTGSPGTLAETLGKWEGAGKPDVVLFIGEKELEARMARAEAELGPLRVVGRAEPGILDRTVHWLNPVNRNETIVIARMESAS
ncbi:MAG TPA: hypothetical protein PLN54_11510, partial [Flavobacteriales bacterium]|nr:hypothetical protein [Flavobacteriales bacterium]